MADDKMSCTLPLTVTLNVSRRPVAPSATNQTSFEAIGARVADAVSRVMSTLGVPGRALVTLSIGDLSTSPGQLVRLSVESREVRYSNELLARVCGAIDERLLWPEFTGLAVGEWLSPHVASSAAASVDTVAGFLSLLSVEILKSQPSILLGVQQLAAYQSHAAASAMRSADDEPVQTPSLAWLGSVLGEILDLGISIGNVATVTQVIGDGLAITRPKASIVEDLVEALRPEAVAIQLPRRDLFSLSTRWQQDAAEAFSSLRQQVLDELGVSLPSFRFVIDDQLEPGRFAFRVNHIASIPVRGLDKDQTPTDQVPLATDATAPAVTPLNLATADVGTVRATHGTNGEAAVGWNQLRDLVLCMIDVLRGQAWRLVNRDETREQLRALQGALPALLNATYAMVPDDEITRTRRALVRAGISVRNLRGVLEPLVERRIRRARPAEGDRESALLVARRSLVPAMAYTLTSAGNELPAFVLSFETGEPARPMGSLLEQEGVEILRALADEMTRRPSTVMLSLLTPGTIRRQIEQLVAMPFPRLIVFSREELPSEIKIKEISRIHVNAIKATTDDAVS